MHVLITGGCGFIGANFVYFLKKERPDWSLTILDNLTYAGNLANLADVDLGTDRYRFIKGDIADTDFVEKTFNSFEDHPDFVVNFAAESHVDRSILGPREFINTNVNGTFNLLEAARNAGTGRYVQISTDEVYGSLGDEGKFVETTPINPNSPYSASKAAADLLVLAHHRTFGLDTVITRCSNNYGPYQFPEKLIPLMVLNSLSGKDLPVYGNGKNVRDWIHVTDHCSGILAAMENGKAGQVYNFGGEAEVANIDIVHKIADTVAGNRDSIKFVEDRPGHDWRYAMDISKVKNELNWAPKVNFEAGMEDTINWYKSNEDWWKPILSGEYTQFYDRLYGNR